MNKQGECRLLSTANKSAVQTKYLYNMIMSVTKYLHVNPNDKTLIYNIVKVIANLLPQIIAIQN